MRETAAVEINTFNAGLVTDASPLTSVDNSSLEEENFVLNSDGSRQRRFGMDFEDDYVTIATTIPFEESGSIAHASYKWKNAGGVTDRNISVVQFGNEVKFFNLSSRPISGNLLHTEGFPDADSSTRFSFTNVDGFLIVVTGEKRPYIFEIDDDLDITVTRQTIFIRDLFGVEDVIGGIDLYSSNGIQTRPSSMSQRHRYNLRNQGWGIPRANATGGGGLGDPIVRFRNEDGNYPSNSDSVISALYADTTITPRTLERFFPEDLSKNPLGTTKAAQGYFIIDALNRGASRVSNDEANRNNFPQLSGVAINLPTDRTPGGASVVSEYAGRAWFGGFSGDIVGGDKLSPRMSSYVLFSRLVRSIGDITQCYQEGDPTSKESPDVVATDGGFIRINEAYGITRMENLGDVLIIMAINGIWMVGPTSDNGFTATNFVIKKISDRGCPNPSSAVVVDNTIFYWSDDGIYHLRTDQFGGWTADSISVNRIQRLFESITESDKLSVIGAYDSFQRKVRWVYDNDTSNERETKELVLDLVLQAFYINKIFNVENGTPRVKSIFNAIAYEITVFQDFVTVEGELVTADSDDVFVVRETLSDVTRGELAYIVAYEDGGNLAYTFCNYTDQGFIDWRSYNNVGVDAEAYMITSYLSGTDFQRTKQVPYITFHFRRTESGLEQAGDDLIVTTPSSCIVQTMWNWANTNGSNKWGRPFQAYRYKRAYIPPTLPADYNTGFPVLQTRHKPRGSGKVLSMRFNSEPGRDLHLYGWSMIFSVAGNV